MYLKQLTTLSEDRGYSIRLVHDPILGIDLLMLEEHSDTPARNILLHPAAFPRDALTVGQSDDAIRNAVYSMRMSRASALILMEDER